MISSFSDIKEYAEEGTLSLEAIWSAKTITVTGDDAEKAVDELMKTAADLNYVGLMGHYFDDNGEMILYNSERDGDVLRFKTDHLSWWAIVGDKTVAGGKISDATITLITMPIMLAVATMAYALIIMGKNKKKKGEIDR